MKTSNYIVFILLAMLTAACGKDDLIPDCPPPTDDVNGLIEMTFTAAAPETRTTLGEKDADGEYPVLWTAGDEIAVIPRTTNGKDYAQSEIAKMKFTTSIEEGETAASATFTGSTYASDGGYAVFYPYCNLTTYNGNWYSDLFYFTIPTEQKAVASSFAPNICPAFVLTKGNVENLSFSPLCGLVKFSLSGDVVSDLASVRFEAAGQPLTGELGCNAYYRLFDNNTSPISHVTLTGTFVAGDDYYMVVVPCYLGGGFSFTFTRKDGSVYVKEGKIEDYYLDSGRIGNFGNIDLSEATFATPSDDDITDMAFIKAVESSTGIALERNDAGYVTLTDKNKELMASVTDLDISNNALTDASALKYFTGLQTLNFSDNNLSELDVSELTNLTDLDCSNNNLEELDVSGLKNLTYLRCYANKLTALTVNGATALEMLSCFTNQLTTLDVSELTKLTNLDCVSNKLTTLTVNGATALETLDCYWNDLEKLDVSELINLTYLGCDGNKLTTLTVNGATALAKLYCYSNQLTTLDVSELTNLTYLDCDGNKLTTLTVNGATALAKLYCYSNQLTSLDVSGLTNLTHLSCYDNNLTTLDISALSDLREIYCGKQTSDGTTQQTLTLTAAQRDDVWKSSLEDGSEYNEPVELSVK